MTMREHLNPSSSEIPQQKPQPKQQTQNRSKQEQQLEVSEGVQALTSQTEQATQKQIHDINYEVFLEQIAHDMAYSDTLTATQKKLLQEFGYQAEPTISGPLGFEMRVFIPSHADYPHPIIAFRGTEFSSLKDLQADLAPKSVGSTQFKANQRRIDQALQRTAQYGRAWVTGHSLGGALAQLTATTYSDQVARVITFQAPGIDANEVKNLEQHNKTSDHDVQSTHYQVSGDVVSTVGDRLTTGEVIKFDMQNSGSSTGKSLTTGILTGILVGPATGAAATVAVDAVAKHRAFPVSNVAQEHPAFQELFEEGKTFERAAGIGKDTFEARKPISSEAFKPARASNFLRHTIGKTTFAIENAASNWGNDAKAREFAEKNKFHIHTFSASTLSEHLGHLLDGWVSDEDIIAFESICYNVKNPIVMQEIRNQLQNRLEELHSEQQRQWIASALAFVPSEDNKIQRTTREKIADQARSKDQEMRERVQRAAAMEAQQAVQPAQTTRNLGIGANLESNQRQRLEEFFGTNLETVRIHTDEKAREEAKNLGAHAATIGENILLGENASVRDDELIAHEVAHVIQQRENRVPDGMDKDASLETEAQNLGRAFAQGRSHTKKKSASKTAESKAVQRKISAKTSAEAWTRDFSGKTGNTSVTMKLTRAEDGSLTGTYQMGASEAIALEGKILESKDNDLYLEGADGSKWHGKYTENNTLLFGNVVIGKKTIKNLELKASAAKPILEENPAKLSNQAWNKTFIAQQGTTKIKLDLTRETDGTLQGGYQLNTDKTVKIEGKLLKDDDIYLESTSGAQFHGRFTNADTLLFGNVHLPTVGNTVARDLKNLQFKVTQEVKPITPASPSELPTGAGAAVRTAGPHRISTNGTQFIAQHEAFRPKMYVDLTGNPTIGYGHKIKPNESDKYSNKVLTPEEGMQLLKVDILLYEAPINEWVQVPLDQQTFDVLVSFVFNAGRDAFKNSDLLKRLNMGDYDCIPIELSRFNKGKDKSGKKVFIQGLANRREAEIDALPADELDLRLGLDGYQRVYTPVQIKEARKIIAAEKETTKKEHLNLLLQNKVAYHNQRDNASTGLPGDRKNNRKDNRIGDIMCNLTSLAMALETVGISNPEPQNFPQFEDYLEHLGETKINNFNRESSGQDGWAGVAKLLGAQVSFLDTGGYGIRKRDWWQSIALNALKAGNGVIFSIHGHIVRLQGVTPFGLVVDDPYGGNIQLSAGSGGVANWGNNAEYGSLLNSRESKDGAIGNDNIWEWQLVEKRSLHWLAAIAKV